MNAHAWRGVAEANRRHLMARATGTGRGVAFEVFAPRRETAALRALLWALIGAAVGVWAVLKVAGAV